MACDLIPKPLIVARYFAEDQGAIDKLTEELEAATAILDELQEEHGGEDGALADFDNKAVVAMRLKEIISEKEAGGEADILAKWLALREKEADFKKRLKEAEAALDAKAYNQYPELTEADIKVLVVDHKWIATLESDIRGEMDRVSQALAERYEVPMSDLASSVVNLETKVSAHLEQMGFI
jgi:type I restriction enzyme M protein